MLNFGCKRTASRWFSSLEQSILGKASSAAVSNDAHGEPYPPRIAGLPQAAQIISSFREVGERRHPAGCLPHPAEGS